MEQYLAVLEAENLLRWKIHDDEQLQYANFWIFLNIPEDRRDVDGPQLKHSGYTSCQEHYTVIRDANIEGLAIRSYRIPEDSFVEEMHDLVRHYNENPARFGMYINNSHDIPSMIGYSTNIRTLLESILGYRLPLAFPLDPHDQHRQKVHAKGIFEEDLALYKVGAPSMKKIRNGSNFWIMSSEPVNARFPSIQGDRRGYTEISEYAQWFLDRGDCTVQSYRFADDIKCKDIINRFLGECELNNPRFGCVWGHPKRTSQWFDQYYRENQRPNQTLLHGAPWPAPEDRKDGNT